MKINEIFYSLQGEGKSMGRPTLFIRFSGCNLRCNWCDTKYHTNNHEITTKEANLLKKHKHWTITGGEPLLQQDKIIELIKTCKPDRIEIETNGTIRPKRALMKYSVFFNCSPKESRFQPKNGQSTEPLLLQSLRFMKYNPLDIAKFVYVDEKSEEFIEGIVKKYRIDPSCVYVMPQGANKAEQIANKRQVWDYCTAKGFSYSARLHIDLFDITQGV